ncbi:MAG: ribonuclease HII [Deltaproteobacteria bacterium]|nr:MAG: ribonuclease HII [Deltaproteobacteria bacterium]
METTLPARRRELVAGVDEAGRGPLAGPVVAAAVMLGDVIPPAGLNDSKQVTARRRQELARMIIDACRGWGIGVVSASRIDEINIRRAALEAMSKAYAQLLAQGVEPDLVLVDGRDVFDLPPRSPAVELRAVVGGDRRSANVAAASILAKVWRDSLLLEYHFQWPQYGFDRHKGYPTRQHLAAIARHGPCPLHRRTFRRVREYCGD